MILDHAVDDIVAWSLATLTGVTITLTERGKRFVSVWEATDQRGFWEFENGTGWLLGKGVFSFRKALKSLHDAGLESETGIILTKHDAKNKLKEYHLAKIQVDGQIKQNILRHSLIQAFEDAKDLATVIEQSLTLSRTRLQLNQLCRMAESALVELQQTAGEEKLAKRTTLLCAALKTITRLKEEIPWQIRDQETVAQEVTHVLLASWLADQVGVLKDIAECEPEAILVRSDCGDVFWMEVSSPIVEPDVLSQTASPADGLISGFLKKLSSFFR